jgi:hypothetical protein
MPEKLHRPLIAANTAVQQIRNVEEYYATVFFDLSQEEKATLLAASHVGLFNIISLIGFLVAKHGFARIVPYITVLKPENMHYYMVEHQKWEYFDEIIKCRMPNDILIKVCLIGRLDYFRKYVEKEAPINEKVIDFIIKFASLAYFLELNIEINSLIVKKIIQFNNIELMCYIRRKRVRCS